MLPPTLIRRLFLAPLVIVIGFALAVLAPPVALLSWAANLIRRRRGDDLTGRGGMTEPRGRRHPVRHYRLLRMMILGLAWVAGETVALTVFLGLWIASGFGGRLDTEPYQARHYAVLTKFLDRVYRVALRTLKLTVTVAGPPESGQLEGDSLEGDSLEGGRLEDSPQETGSQETGSRGTGPHGTGPHGTGPQGEGLQEGNQPGDRPVIVLSRHAGPGDSVLIIQYLLSECERRPRVVMKATLQLDPTVDIIATRLPNAFLNRAKSTGVNGTRQRTEQIRRLAAGMSGRSALVIFPEGGNWTPLRWNRAIERLRRRGHPDLAQRAAAMPNLLPPHGSGALTAIAACPAADVIFVAHTGLDRLVSVRDVWRSLHTDLEIRARWWRVPADRVPRTASPDAQLGWLYDWWERIDAWITAENRAVPGLRPPVDVAPADVPPADVPAGT
jgi:1-acyl-sn-glycerol-3-phosphate acyltransferase